jgi:uncharacterized protein (DUF4415 family)
MEKKEKSLKSDLARVKAMKDEEIDYSDGPELDDSFFKRTIIELPKPKTQVTIRLDTPVLEWFKSQGKGYQTRMNAILKSYMEAARNSLGTGK